MENKNKGLDTFDHVVVLMLENRSFDNLLGYLYEGGVPEGKTFEGLHDKTIKMPVPPDAIGYNKDHPYIEPGQTGNYHQPFPDPGEVYQHVNTQIFNFINDKKPDNRGIPACKMGEPYNIPEFYPLGDAQMKGFVKDYINTLSALKNSKYNKPTADQYSVIMQCFIPEKVNVLKTLAQEFAVFDHWFCSVPSQTWCNRAFWHAATSGGEVVNPTDECGIIDKVEALVKWKKQVWSQPTIFDRMEDKGVSHAVYTEDPISLTRLVNNSKNQKTIHTGDKLKQFKSDINQGNLPKYTFLEPKFYGQHNDQHPSSADWSIVDSHTHVGTVLLGEQLIWDVYNSLFIDKKSKYRDNTLLIITYDEHGGCFDHVPPPSAVPPKKGMIGDKGFKFDRLGVRVPMVMVSANIQKNTIVNEVFDHTSFIKTMCKKWGMDTLTDRDAAAKSFEHVFSGAPREDFPVIDEPQIPKTDPESYNNDPLNDLQKSILIGANFIAKNSENASKSKVDFEKAKSITTVGDALEHLEKIKELL